MALASRKTLSVLKSWFQNFSVFRIMYNSDYARRSIVLLLVSCTLSTYSNAQPQPEQVHISYGGNVDRMLVTWVSLDVSQSAQVQYGLIPAQLSTMSANSTPFTDGGLEKRTIHIHRAELTDLQPGTRYYYRVGNDQNWSKTYNFTALKQNSTDGYRFCVFGDMGLENARSLGPITDDIRNGNIDMILHIGDFAYDMDSDNARVADKFFRMIEPIASHIPYMAVPGNHEQRYNFSNYVNRFTMPNTEHNHYYSYNLGPIHFVGISTEFYYYVKYGRQQIGHQYDWLSKDLINANLDRSSQPWIIVMGHRPMYCSNNDADSCTRLQTRTRVGMPWLHKYGLEELFYNHGVDLQIWAHEHNYERLWPVYKRRVYNGSTDAYTNPAAPTHMITGSAGCREKHGHFRLIQKVWSAFRCNDYGYSRMHVFNNTHLYWEQVSVEKDKVIDSIWLVRDVHGPYSDTKRQAEHSVYVPEDYQP